MTKFLNSIQGPFGTLKIGSFSHTRLIFLTIYSWQKKKKKKIYKKKKQKKKKKKNAKRSFDHEKWIKISSETEDMIQGGFYKRSQCEGCSIIIYVMAFYDHDSKCIEGRHIKDIFLSRLFESTQINEV